MFDQNQVKNQLMSDLFNLHVSSTLTKGCSGVEFLCLLQFVGIQFLIFIMLS